jgi:hypothetical protein
VAQFHQYQLRAGGSPNHCGPFSIAIAANILLGAEVFDGDVVATELSRRFIEWRIREGQFLPIINRFPREAATLPGAFVRYFREHGIGAKLHALGKYGQLMQALNDDKVVIPIIGQWTYRHGKRWQPWAHAKVMVGYTPSHILAIDPAVPMIDEDTLCPQPITQFLTRWRSMGRIWIEIGG